MFVWWNQQELSNGYHNVKKTISCSEQFETNEEYFLKVIGRVPDEFCPEPPLVLRDYVKYEVTQDVVAPEGYITLERRKSTWPEDQRRWPSRTNIDMLERRWRELVLADHSVGPTEGH